MTQSPMGSNPQEPDPLAEGGPGQPDVLPTEGEGIPEDPTEPVDDPAARDSGTLDQAGLTHSADPYPGLAAP